MIHPTSKISPHAKIAKDVEIGAFCTIGSGAVLKSGVKLHHHINIDGDTVVDQNTQIFSFAQIGSSKQAIKIGTGCTIREFANIGIGDNADPETIVIGDECYIMGYADIKSGVVLKNNCIITNSVLLGEKSRYEERVIIGAKASVAPECIIGEGTMVGGVSHVAGNIPPFCLVEGHPAAEIKGLNLVGMRRNFKDRKSISYVKKAFMSLRKQNFDQKKAQKMLSLSKDEYEKKFIDFIASYNVHQ